MTQNAVSLQKARCLGKGLMVALLLHRRIYMEGILDLLKKTTSRAYACTFLHFSFLTKGHLCGLCLESKSIPGQITA